METKDRLIEIRNYFKPNSASAFAAFIEIPQTTYSSYENGKRKISAELVEALVVHCNINTKWFFTGEGEMFLAQDPILERKIPDNDAAYWLHTVGERVLKVQKFFDYSNEKMANIFDITTLEYIDLVTKSRFPKGKVISVLNNFKDNFKGITIDELLYNDTNTFDLRLKKGDKVEIDLSTLSPEKLAKVKNLLKEI